MGASGLVGHLLSRNSRLASRHALTDVAIECRPFGPEEL